MAGLWENLFGGATTAGGIYALMDQLRGDRSNVQDTISGLQNDVNKNIQFNPYSVTTGMGTITQGPGGVTSNLSSGYQDLVNQMLGGASGALQQTGGAQDYLSSLLTSQRAGQTDPRSYQGIADQKRQAFGLGSQYMGLAGQDPRAREGDIYNRIRQMQRPEEQRQMETMNNNLFASGRGGMGSSTYGASPEQFAYNKALNEARNQASYQALDQAQQEMLNYGQMGQQFGSMGADMAGLQQDLASKNVTDITNIANQMGNLGFQGAQTAGGLFASAMSPYEQMMNQAGVGQANQGMNLETILNRQKMLGDLGLGGLGTELNYSNIMGNLLGQAIPGLASAAGGLGGVVDDAGGLFATLGKIFG